MFTYLSGAELDALILDPSCTMQDCIKNLNDNKYKIAIVCEIRKVLGVVTDGDVRRALLNGCDMSESVLEVMNSSPVLGLDTDTHVHFEELMHEKGIFHIPLLDKAAELSSIAVSDTHVLNVSSLDNPVVIAAGGFGKRLRPLTLSTPKPLLEVGGKPVIQTTIERLSNSGFENIFISTHYKSNMLKDYLKDGSSFGVNISYLQEEKPLGTAGALSLLPVDGNTSPIVLMNGDLLTNIDFADLVRYHKSMMADVTVCVRDYEVSVPFGVVQYEDNIMLRVDEKPQIKFSVNAGIYIINSQLVSRLPHNDYLDMPNFINRLLEDKSKIAVFPIHEYWCDIGKLEDFEEAQKKYHEHF